MSRALFIGVLGVACSLGVIDASAQTRGGAGAPAPSKAAAPTPSKGPAYRVDPLWPKPLPNRWVLGPISGVAVDAQNHVWIVHRGADGLENNEKGMMLTPPTSSVCCIAAPAVLEFDQAGTVLSFWGGSNLGFAWPQSVGGMAVDSKGNVWIAAFGLEPVPGGRGGRGRGEGAGAPAAAAAPAAQDAAARGRGAAPPAPVPTDAHVTKYSRSGTMLLQIGKPGDVGNPESTTSLNRPAGIGLDEAANEVYIADSGSHRIVVFDSNTGAYKRHWGGTGEKSTAAGAGEYDPAAPVSRQFRDVTCVKVARDGMVYVCDRTSNRIQVFQKNGTFVKETIIAKDTRGAVVTIGQTPGVILNSAGSVWDVGFSSDAAQRYLFVADGHNNRIRILQRESLAEVGQIGDGGRQPGRFLAPGSVAVDSRGVLYTGEQHHAKRVQKFVPVAAAAAAAAAPASK